MMISGKLHIKMLSDWHIGSGTGRPGNIDRLIQRDTHNLPYIPAKSLTGLWRDGCELVAQGLDGGVAGPWQQWVNWLFGEQQPGESDNRISETAPLMAKLSVRSAHFSKELQAAFQGKDNLLLQRMNTFVKPGVKLNPRTGSALADCLRFEEMARAGAVLAADYCLELDGLTENQQQIAQAILVTGTSIVERLGAKRRRGAGHCKISVDGMLPIDKAIAEIERTQGQPPSFPESSPVEHNGTLALDDDDKADWWRILLEVTTQSPVIIHQRTVGNYQETQDYIPGTHFVPVLLKTLKNYWNQSSDNRLGNALMHGDLVITNANPVVQDRRGEAVPFAVFEPKNKTEPARIYQRIGKAIEAKIPEGQQIKGMRNGYIGLTKDRLHRLTVHPQIATHNTISDREQRPNETVGGIYTYAAIPTGMCFRLEIRIRDYLVPKTAVNPFANFLATTTPLQIGRTKKDDYGNVQIQQIGEAQKITNGTLSQSKTLNVWLLSDLLLRDKRLRPTADLKIFGEQLEKKLGAGVTLRLLEPSENGLPFIKNMVAFARCNRIESWQRKWSLPRPSLMGLSAGTILQFQVIGEIDLEKLQALEISGFGERTAEGYGQLRFNPPLLTQTDLKLGSDSQYSQISISDEKPVLIKENTPGYSYARLVETETWRELIRQAAGAIAADPDKLPLGLTGKSLSQSKLGTLRTLIDSLTSVNDTTRILTVIKRMEAKESWKSTTLKEIKQLIENQNKVWQHYQKIRLSDYRLTTLDEQTLKQELWVEAVRILVDACIRAYQRASEQG
ncbi:putative RAMP superfamily protein probably involved in DNA repair [Leptolyngbya sp. PCC 7375]|nr:putative RAMP superfamily protein probably involved in DNA repair [Leptolyngbya sp. PCC 7375]